MGIVLSGIVVFVTAVWFWWNDRKLPKKAQALEWIPSPRRAEEIATAYSASDRRRVGLALIVDSLLFVPAYVMLLGSMQRGDTMVIALMIAGVLDWLENIGIWLEVKAARYGLAPFVAGCAYVKWAIVIASIVIPIWRWVTLP